jgi:hypothetical protein
VIFDAAQSTAALARGSGGHECGDLAGHDLTLQFQQQRLGLSETQTDVFQSLVLLLQHDNVVVAHVTVIDHHHQLQS